VPERLFVQRLRLLDAVRGGASKCAKNGCASPTVIATLSGGSSNIAIAVDTLGGPLRSPPQFARLARFQLECTFDIYLSSDDPDEP
jgi:hypothetical protein